MEDKNKLIITSWEEWIIISKWVDINVKTTDDELLNALVEMPDSDNFLAKLKEKKLANKREQYEKLKPIWFEYAPEKAKKYRYELECSDDVEQMKYLSSILTYNQDNTVGLPTIKETFWVDLKGSAMTREQSMKLAKSKWYHLLSCWNFCDLDSEKQSTDWYKLENLFWEYVSKWALFCMLGFSDYRYWTSTKHKNEKWEESENSILHIRLNENKCDSDWHDMNFSGLVCGFKDMTI